MPRTLVVGTCARYIHILSFGPALHELQHVRAIAAGGDPNWVEPDPRHPQTLYITNEESLDDPEKGALIRLNLSDPSLTTTALIDEGACHALVLPGGSCITSNYGSGSFQRVDPGGLVVARFRAPRGTGHVADRQVEPHAHQATLDPISGLVLAADLGADTVFRLDPLDLSVKGVVPLPPGTGPRHITRHPSLQSCVYVLGELAADMHVFHIGNDGEWQETQSFSLLPPFATRDAIEQSRHGYAQPSIAAEVQITPDGATLVASVRYLPPCDVENDILFIAPVDTASGHVDIAQAQHVDLKGTCPRHFEISPDGDYLALTLQDSNRVDIYKMNGRQLELVASIDIEAPTCVRWL